VSRGKVGVNVAVGVSEGGSTKVAVRCSIEVASGVSVRVVVGVAVSVSAGSSTRVAMGFSDEVAVGVSVGDAVKVSIGVAVRDAVGVSVGVIVEVLVGELISSITTKNSVSGEVLWISSRARTNIVRHLPLVELLVVGVATHSPEETPKLLPRSSTLSKSPNSSSVEQPEP